MGLLDMIGPVMVGPSSSHTAGACRLALLARHLLGEKPKRVEFGLHGSFAKTGKGHGTHLALAAGVLGLTPDDERLKESLSLAEREGVEVRTEEAEVARSAVYASDPAVGRYYAGLFHLPVIAPHRPLAEVVVELGPDLLH